MAKNSTVLCQCSDDDGDLVGLVQFVLEGLGIPLVGVLGLLGNVAAVVVLRYNNKYCLQAVRLDIGKIKITITEQIVATKYRKRCQKRKCTKILHRLRFYGKI